MANLVIHANTSNQDFPLGTSGIEFTEIDLVNDTLIISGGSTQVADGQPLPSQNDLLQAGIVITTPSTEIIYDKYLLADFTSNELKELFLMGDLDSQYVLAFDFDGATASEPVLEIWDDINLSTADSIILGGTGVSDSGIATSSFIRGITTTSSSSGAPGWVGKRLAGSSDGHFLFLNDGLGPLTTATTLYCNLKVIHPASQTVGYSNTPVMAIKYTSN